MKLRLTWLGWHLICAATAELAEDEAHSTLNAPTPEAVLLAELWEGSSAMKLKMAGTLGGVAESINQEAEMVKIDGMNKFSATVCKDSTLDSDNNCPNAADMRYPLFDGSCNNRIDTNRGKANRPLKRLLHANYGDDRSTPRLARSGSELPSARVCSNEIAREVTRVEAVTHMLTQWGQFITHDIVHTPVIKAPDGEDLDCNCAMPHKDCINIPIPMSDKQYLEANKTCFSLPRSIPSPDKECNFDYRQQVNQISAYIDGTTVYGTDDSLINDIRDPDSDSGELLTSKKYSGAMHGETLPQNNDMKHSPSKPFNCPMKLNRAKDACFLAGDKRINENAGLASMHTMFMREHNRVARKLKSFNPHWDSDKVFHETRLIINALHQVVTYGEYLPIVVGGKYMNRYQLDLAKTGYYYGYDATFDATISNAFTTAAFRFGHSMISDQLARPGPNWEDLEKAIPMKDALFNPEIYLNDSYSGINPILRGLLVDKSLKSDTNFATSMKDFLFAEMGMFGKDLFAINIQRGREHGLRGYNDYRAFFGMQRATTFAEFREVSPDLRARLAEIYEHVDDVDLYVGGLSEDPVEGGVVGPLFAHLIGYTFRDIKRGDRFFFENGACETSFTPAQVDELRKMKLASLICTCTDTVSIQPDIFLLPGPGNERVPCGDIYQLNFEAWTEPYFHTRETNGFQDSGKWSVWLPPMSNPNSLELAVLSNERPDDTCKNSIGSELRFVNDSPQVRYLCPWGVMLGNDFPPACLDQGKWTPWFDRSNPNGNDASDIEMLSQLTKERPGEICEKPLFLQVQTVDEVPARETGEVFEIFDAHRGFVCHGKHQDDNKCEDYRVRYFCAKNSVPVNNDVEMALEKGDVEWSKWFSSDKPTDYGDVEYLESTRQWLPGLCADPIAMEARSVDDEMDARETGDVFRWLRKDKGLVCLNDDQTDGQCSDYETRYLCPKEYNFAVPIGEYSDEFMTNGNVASANKRTGFPLEVVAESQNLCSQYGICCADALEYPFMGRP